MDDDTGTDRVAAPCPEGAWRVADGRLCHDGAIARPFGANGMHVFGPGSADMTAWKLTLAREFIGNLRDVPLEGWPIQDEHGRWLHPPRTVVEDNRANGLASDEAQAELRALDDLGLAWMVGEGAPMNAGTLMDPRPFLALPEVAARSVAAWLWKRSDTDLDALLDANGAPNDRDNHAWGSTIQALAHAR